ncbi:DUF6850 family outer membrane beta-barrel protein [uncultured Bacteroides sp.]|uniref:DUF6850 family outer membrane beta-barrel protein n=1 Tax=uncultured Bacteroides sp. TaxID=162156 RepID=UPI002AA67E4D|nr:DUF6850 family outer membrane beta-barrel protein [uncultured Bacteroides sp.]
MKLRCLIFSLLCIVLLPFVRAADTLAIERKIIYTQSPVEHFRNQVWANPSLRYYLQDFSFSSMALNVTLNNRGKAALAEEGDEKKVFGVQAESFVRLSDQVRVFGKAGYSDEHTKNVLWNETSDFSVIYPYVTADSIGGSMDGEEYSFMGGYARVLGLWTIGASLDYRAAIYYRQKDPRPKNVISDLHAVIGVSRALADAYHLGVALHVRKYDQESKITFLSDLGSTSVYHMLGMAMNYVRFAGNQFNSNYKGKGIGLSIDLIPQKKNGLSTSVRADHFQLIEQLSNINYAPIVEVDENSAALELAWLRSKNKFIYGTKLVALGKFRTGTENIFGDPTGNVYPIISSLKQYTNDLMEATLSGIMASNAERSKLGWSVLPFVGVCWEKSEYKKPQRYMEWTTLKAGMQLNTTLRTRHAMLTTEVTADYHANLKAEKLLTGLNSQSAVGQNLLNSYAYQSVDFVHVLLSCRYDYLLAGNKTAFTTITWGHGAYKEYGATNQWMASVGFTF